MLADVLLAVGLVAPAVAESTWDLLAECESGGDWTYNGSSGYDGGLQFDPDTWLGVDGDDFAPHAYQATRAEQIVVAERLLAVQGWEAWPTCSERLNLTTPGILPVTS